MHHLTNISKLKNRKEQDLEDLFELQIMKMFKLYQKLRFLILVVSTLEYCPAHVLCDVRYSKEELEDETIFWITIDH